MGKTLECRGIKSKPVVISNTHLYTVKTEKSNNGKKKTAHTVTVWLQRTLGVIWTSMIVIQKGLKDHIIKKQALWIFYKSAFKRRIKNSKWDKSEIWWRIVDGWTIHTRLCSVNMVSGVTLCAVLAVHWPGEKNTKIIQSDTQQFSFQEPNFMGPDISSITFVMISLVSVNALLSDILNAALWFFCLFLIQCIWASAFLSHFAAHATRPVTTDMSHKQGLAFWRKKAHLAKMKDFFLLKGHFDPPQKRHLEINIFLMLYVNTHDTHHREAK